MLRSLRVEVADDTNLSHESRQLPGSDLGKLFRHGSAWSIASYGGSQVLRLGSNLILWRLVSAEAFGLIALVTTLMNGLTMFSEIGIGPSIVQNERGDDRDYLNTAWTMQVLRGAALFLLASATAYPIAQFYKQPELVALIPFVAAGALISGFNSTKLFSASRKLELRSLTIIELATQAISIVAMLGLAYVTHSVWALAFAAIGTSTSRLVLGYAMLRGSGNRFRWDRSSARTLSRFGRWIFPSTMLIFFATSSDRLIFGKFISIGQLGVYSIAAIWASIPVYVLGHLFSNVVFPLLSRARNEGRDVAAWFHETRRPVIIAAAWLATCLIAGGPTGMVFLYNQRAADAGWIVQILALGAWLHALENGNSNAVLAMGQPKWLAAANGAKVAGMFVLIPCGFHLGRAFGIGGFPGAVWGFALSDALKCGVSMLAAARAGIGAFRQDLTLSAGIALFAAFGSLVGTLATRSGLPLLLQGVAIFVAVSVPWALVYRQKPESHVGLPA